MKEIKLTQNKVALVDDSDFEWLNKLTWCAAKRKHTYYAYTTNLKGKRGSTIAMHRLIMETPIGKRVDHKDHNGLNCQRNNMRNCTNRENQMNKTPHGSSKYLGVSFCKINNNYHAQIRINGNNTHIGYYKNEIDAALAYNEKAKIHHGEFANLNQVANYIRDNANKL